MRPLFLSDVRSTGCFLGLIWIRIIQEQLGPVKVGPLGNTLKMYVGEQIVDRRLSTASWQPWYSFSRRSIRGRLLSIVSWSWHIECRRGLPSQHLLPILVAEPAQVEVVVADTVLHGRDPVLPLQLDEPFLQDHWPRDGESMKHYATTFYVYVVACRHAALDAVLQHGFERENAPSAPKNLSRISSSRSQIDRRHVPLAVEKGEQLFRMPKMRCVAHMLPQKLYGYHELHEQSCSCTFSAKCEISSKKLVVVLRHRCSICHSQTMSRMVTLEESFRNSWRKPYVVGHCALLLSTRDTLT